jgi:hypothetical protein
MNALCISPFLQATLGGEGWVRGQRDGLPKRRENATRLPLTPTLSPIACAMGEREMEAFA